MPTYNYGCDACGHEFEREQRMSDKPIKKCPQCGKPKARRLITSGNFILKGSGWYADGYASPAEKDKNKDKGSDAGDNKAPESSSDSEAKPAEAKPAKKKKAKSGEAGSTA